MSAARIEKLNGLLERVRTRRAEPRLMSIRGANALESANTNVAQREAAVAHGPTLVEAPRPEARAEAPRPEAARPAPQPAAEAPEQARRPTSSIQPAISLDSEPPAAPTEPPLQLKTPSSTVPPPAAPVAEAPQRAQTEVLPASPVRIAPSPAAPFDSAVKVVSSPRIEAPKTFGELLELSLSLRPK